MTYFIIDCVWTNKNIGDEGYQTFVETDVNRVVGFVGKESAYDNLLLYSELSSMLTEEQITVQNGIIIKPYEVDDDQDYFEITTAGGLP